MKKLTSLLPLMLFGISATIVKPAVNMAMTSTYDPGFNLMGDYILNAYAEDIDTLLNYSEAIVRPSNIICHINQDGYFTNSQGVPFEERYADVYEWYIKGKMIPIYYVKDLETAANLISYYETDKIYDMGVVSDDFAVLSSVKEACPTIHAVADLSSISDEEFIPSELIGQIHQSGARTVILPPRLATYENVYYFQARTKCVWVDDREASDIEIIQEVTDGVYGGIYDNITHPIELLNVFNKKSLNRQYNYNRPSLNIAHRGLYISAYENSLEGCIAAYEAGATHFEIDIHVTKDKKLAVMHDETIDRTTNGTGLIANYTSDELKGFRIDVINDQAVPGDGVSIPMLDEFFTEFKGKDIIMVIEIKNQATDCVEILKQYIEEYEVQDQCLVISFYKPQLARMKETLPQIPTADLNSYADGTLMASLEILGRSNMIPDANSSNHTSAFVHHLAERGFESWFWTYTDNTSLLGKTGINGRVYGLTNNVASTMKDFPIGLSMEKEATFDWENEDNVLPATYLTYGGEGEECEASPLFVEDHGEYALAIFQSYFTSNTVPKFKAVVYSDVIKLNKPSQEEEQTSSTEESMTTSESTQTSSEDAGQVDTDPKKGSSANMIAILIPSIVGGVALVGVAVFAVVRIAKARKKK